jgi:hypothetical protein
VFRALLSYAMSGLTNLMAKYAVRFSVAVPFLFAFGFGLAGLTVVLVDAFGYRDAYFLLTGGFAGVGLIAAIAVWLKERSEEPESPTGIEPRVARTAVESAKQIPSAIAAGASDASSGFRDLTNLAARNWPLVMAAGIVVIALGGARPENRHDHRYRSRL